MARGWESKSVEDQITSAEERKATPDKPPMSSGDRESLARTAGLLLSRAKVLSDLQSARNERYRAILQQSLDYIDAEIERCGVGAPHA